MRTALTNIYSSRGLQPQDEAAMVGYLYLFISSLMKETSESKPHSTSSSSQYVPVSYTHLTLPTIYSV